MVKVYTKTGDDGITSLYNGARLPKSDIVFEALGNVDELSSMIGVARSYNEDEQIEEQLTWIQDMLLKLGSAIATPVNTSSHKKVEKTRFPETSIHRLEEWIDVMDFSLPTLTTFILPSGSKFSSFIHVCRTICRRAERHSIPLMRNDDLDRECIQFLNRLSDYFFTLARFSG
jgi:cob(I)alamin adenosyltransferase